MDKDSLDVVKGIFYMGTVAVLAYGVYTAFVSLV